MWSRPYLLLRILCMAFLCNLVSVSSHLRQGAIKKNDASMFILTTTLREDYREPYWEDGHWVFDRYKFTTTSTPKPMTTTTEETSTAGESSSMELDPDTVLLFAEETPPPTTTRTTDAIDFQKYNTEATHSQCNVICLRIYIRYGMVCATRIVPPGQFPSWNYIYKTFDNICGVERANCMDFKERPEWRLAHTGPCVKKTTSEWKSGYPFSTIGDFTIMPTDYNHLADRAASWQRKNYTSLSTGQEKMLPVYQLTDPTRGWFDWLGFGKTEYFY